jgi:hypothetical protein
MIRIRLPYESKRFRAYEIEFGAGGDRLGCKFLLDEGSILFVHESLMASLGSPTDDLMHSASMTGIAENASRGLLSACRTENAGPGRSQKFRRYAPSSMS